MHFELIFVKGVMSMFILIYYDLRFGNDLDTTPRA